MTTIYAIAFCLWYYPWTCNIAEVTSERYGYEDGLSGCKRLLQRSYDAQGFKCVSMTVPTWQIR